MKKILVILAIIVFSSVALFAQNQPQVNDPVDVTNTPAAGQQSTGSSSGGGLIFGAQIGFGSAFIKETTDNNYSGYGYIPIVNYSVGGRVGYYFGSIGVLFDLEYIRKGAKEGDTTLKLHYIDVDIMFSVKFGGFYAGLGLYFGTALSKTLENPMSVYEANNIRTTDFGWVLEFGYMFGSKIKFMTGLEIKMSLQNILVDAGADNYNWKNVSIMFKFGVLFG